MDIDVLTAISQPGAKEHPSHSQRKKLVAERKQRLAEALRENLRKRKAQLRARQNSQSEKDEKLPE